MDVDIDKARQHIQALRVADFLTGLRRKLSDLGNPAVLDAHVRLLKRAADKRQTVFYQHMSLPFYHK